MIPLNYTKKGAIIMTEKQRLYKMYVDDKMSMIEIAETLRVCRPTITKRLKYYKIPIRSKGRQKGKECGFKQLFRDDENEE